MTTPDDYVTFIEHEGEQILLIDFRHCARAELAQRVDAAARIILTSPERSLLTLTLAHGILYNRETMTLLGDYVKKNRPHVIAGAVVGLDYLSPVVSPMNRRTGRRLRAFDDQNDARDFLVEEKRRLQSEAVATSPPPATPPVRDEFVRWEEYRGERLLVMNFGDCNTVELSHRIEKAISVIHSEPPRSIVALNQLRNFPFGREATAAVLDFVKSNRPYVIAAAAVGLGYMKPAIPVLNRLTRRNIRAFDDETDAREWLASERRRVRMVQA